LSAGRTFDSAIYQSIEKLLKEKEVIDGMIILLLSLTSGCAYHVAFKMPDSYQYETTIPLQAAFYMNETLKGEMYHGKAWSSGIANRWDVPIGDAVNKYAVSYLPGGFASFSEINSLDEKAPYELLIKVDDINYYMEGQASHCDLTFVIKNSPGNEVFRKKYHADGPSGYGRVFVAGAFAQKSAIRQSTHVVMENIFKELMHDIRTNYKGWNIR